MTRWFRPLTTLAFIAVLSAQGPGELQILLIGGEGSINNVKQRTAREPVVEIRDRNNRPVAGALVVFEAPRQGASGSFFGGSPTLRVTTDEQGRASARDFRPNQTAGNFAIQVTATYQGLTATAALHMSNVAAAAAAAGVGVAAAHAKLMGILIGVAAAAAAGGAYAVTHTGNGPTTSPSALPVSPVTTISAGPGTVGARP
jgi:hypothetical protein